MIAAINTGIRRFGELLDRSTQGLIPKAHRHLLGGTAALVGDELAQGGCILVSDGPVQAGDHPSQVADLLHLGGLELGGDGEAMVRPVARPPVNEMKSTSAVAVPAPARPICSTRWR